MTKQVTRPKDISRGNLVFQLFLAVPFVALTLGAAIHLYSLGAALVGTGAALVVGFFLVPTRWLRPARRGWSLLVAFATPVGERSPPTWCYQHGSIFLRFGKDKQQAARPAVT